MKRLQPLRNGCVIRVHLHLLPPGFFGAMGKGHIGIGFFVFLAFAFRSGGIATAASSEHSCDGGEEARFLLR